MGVVEGVDPGGIVWFRIGAVATWFAGIGSALAPIARRLVERDRRGSSMRFRQEQRKSHRRDCGGRRNRTEIERDHCTAQTGSSRLSREKINALTVAEETFGIFIQRVVFLWRQRNHVGKSGAAHYSEKQEGRERLVCLHQAGPKDLSDISSAFKFLYRHRAQAAEYETGLIQVVGLDHRDTSRVAHATDDGAVIARHEVSHNR